MHKSVVRIIFAICFIVSVSTLSAQSYREVNFKQIDSLVQIHPDTLHVVNFWATWCKPCVQELPYFEAASETFKTEAVKFIFISLDFDQQVNSKLLPFLNDNPLPGEVWWLNEKKLNTMIDKVEKNWSGAIPFTLFLKGDPLEKDYYEGELSKEKLERKIVEKI